MCSGLHSGAIGSLGACHDACSHFGSSACSCAFHVLEDLSARSLAMVRTRKGTNTRKRQRNKKGVAGFGAINLHRDSECFEEEVAEEEAAEQAEARELFAAFDGDVSIWSRICCNSAHRTTCFHGNFSELIQHSERAGSMYSMFFRPDEGS